jgi:hypothetical protein
MSTLGFLLLYAPPAAIPPETRLPPAVVIDFGKVPLKPGHKVQIAYEVFTADGDSYTSRSGFSGLLNLGDITEVDAEDMQKVGWKAKADAEGTKLLIYGAVDKNGKVVRPAVRGEVWTRGLTSHEVPKVRNPPPPPVTFDLGVLPLAPGKPVILTFGVVPAVRDHGQPASVELRYEKAARRADLAATLAERFTKAGLKAVAVGNVVRVRGWPDKDEAVHPAAGGTVTSRDLTPAELPKVGGLPRPASCVEIDFVPLASARWQKVKLVYEFGPAEGGRPFRDEHAFDELFPPVDTAGLLEYKLVGAGFKVERDGAKLRVYGWADEKMRLHPTTGGRIESADLKTEQLPTAKYVGRKL